MEEKKVLDAMESAKLEAMTVAINAFNEGFMLGEQYAKELYKDKK